MACYTAASIRCWAVQRGTGRFHAKPHRRHDRCSLGAWAMGDDQRKPGSDLFIIDNSDADWKVTLYV